MNGRRFIAGTTSRSPGKRLRQHREWLLAGKHYNVALQQDFKKFGADAFRFESLERCRFRSLLYLRQQAWLDRAREEGVDVYNRRMRVCRPTPLQVSLRRQAATRRRK